MLSGTYISGGAAARPQLHGEPPRLRRRAAGYTTYAAQPYVPTLTQDCHF